MKYESYKRLTPSELLEILHYFLDTQKEIYKTSLGDIIALDKHTEERITIHSEHIPREESVSFSNTLREVPK